MNLVKRNPDIHAGSIVCLFDKQVKRPLGANLIYNSVHGDPAVNSFGETLATIIHEVFHGLFFDFKLYKRFQKTRAGEKPIFKDANGTYQVRSDEIVEFAKKHFNCKLVVKYMFSSKL